MTLPLVKNYNKPINVLGFNIHTNIEAIEFNGNKTVINTINPHSYCLSKVDPLFCDALKNCDFLLPDGIGIVLAARFLIGTRFKRIPGYDLHKYLLNQMNNIGGKVFYLGSSNITLKKIADRIRLEYPNIKVSSYSPPFKSEFSLEDNINMVQAINDFQPDVLFVGMTAPKQEKWAWKNKDQIHAKTIASIGAVFDFYGGSARRSPIWMQKIGMEWLHRSLVNPKKLGKRNILSNPKFVFDVIMYKLTKKT